MKNYIQITKFNEKGELHVPLFGLYQLPHLRFKITASLEITILPAEVSEGVSRTGERKGASHIPSVSKHIAELNFSSAAEARREGLCGPYFVASVDDPM